MLRDAINDKLPYPCVSHGHGPWLVSASGRIKDWAPIMFYDPNGNHASVFSAPPQSWKLSQTTTSTKMEAC